MNNAAKEKVKFGLKQLHYALKTIGTDGAVTYEKPKPLPGAISISLSADGDKIEFYADDMVYFSDNTNQGYTGDAELALVPDDFKTDVFGDEIINEMLYENADAIVKHIALMGEFNTNVVKKRFCLYDVLCTRPEFSSKTTEKTKTPQTQKMSLTVRPIEINGHNVVKNTTCATTSEQAFNNYFNAVPLPTAANE